eukprot:5597089-Amphidinium_carterae.1
MRVTEHNSSMSPCTFLFHGEDLRTLSVLAIGPTKKQDSLVSPSRRSTVPKSTENGSSQQVSFMQLSLHATASCTRFLHVHDDIAKLRSSHKGWATGEHPSTHYEQRRSLVGTPCRFANKNKKEDAWLGCSQVVKLCKYIGFCGRGLNPTETYAALDVVERSLNCAAHRCVRVTVSLVQVAP